MKVNPEVVRGGKRWFFLMGAAAFGLTVFLYRTDRWMTESDAELVKGDMLRELRTAQASYDTTSLDYRREGSIVTSKDVSALVRSSLAKIEEADSASESDHMGSDAHSHK